MLLDSLSSMQLCGDECTWKVTQTQTTWPIMSVCIYVNGAICCATSKETMRKGVDEGEKSSTMWHVNRKAMWGHGGVHVYKYLNEI